MAGLFVTTLIEGYNMNVLGLPGSSPLETVTTSRGPAVMLDMNVLNCRVLGSKATCA